MGKIRLWLSVYEKRCPMGPSQLWFKNIEAAFAPREGDNIYLSVSENDESESSVEWYVYRHFWNHDGSYDLNLAHMVVDPEDLDVRVPGSRYAANWWTNRDGDPEPMLRRGGWKLWT